MVKLVKDVEDLKGNGQAEGVVVVVTNQKLHVWLFVVNIVKVVFESFGKNKRSFFDFSFEEFGVVAHLQLT